MTMNASPIGLVGLGQMGLPICSRLRTVRDVVAFDISEERRSLASETGASVTASLADLSGCPVVVLSLPTPAVSHEVVSQLAPLLARGALLIETSTVLPADVRAIADLATPHGVRVLDAAILSGVAQMSNGEATLLVGGDPSDVEDAREALDALGPAGMRTFGWLGSGMAAKVVNNGVAHAVMVILAEALALARSQGISLTEITDMLAQPDGGLMRPLTHRVQERMATGDYDGGMPLDAARKDSILALALAQSSGVPLFATQGAHTVYELGAAAGLGRKDYSAIATLWEEWIGDHLSYRGEK